MIPMTMMFSKSHGPARDCKKCPASCDAAGTRRSRPAQASGAGPPNSRKEGSISEVGTMCPKWRPKLLHPFGLRLVSEELSGDQVASA